MNYGKAHQIALCGVLGALMLVLMLLGSMLPLATYLSPLLAALMLVPVLREYGGQAGGTLLGSIAVLGLLLVPDKELALLFALLFGPYTLLQPKIERLPTTPLRYPVKFLLCNLLLVLVYALLLFVLAPTALVAEFQAYSVPVLALLWLVCNAVFFLYDLLLRRCIILYEQRLRQRLFHPKRNKQ